MVVPDAWHGHVLPGGEVALLRLEELDPARVLAEELASADAAALARPALPAAARGRGRPEEPELPGLVVVPLQELALLAVARSDAAAPAAGSGALYEDGPEGDGARLDPDVGVVAPLVRVGAAEGEIGGDVLPDADLLDERRHALLGLHPVQVARGQAQRARLQPQHGRLLHDLGCNSIDILERSQGCP